MSFWLSEGYIEFLAFLRAILRFGLSEGYIECWPS